MPRLAYRPTAVMALQIEQLLRLLGFLAVPTCHHLARTHARTAIFVQHEIGGLIFPAIPPLGEIYGAPCLWPRRSVPRLAPLNPSPRATVTGSLQPQGQRRRSRMDRWPFQPTSRQPWPEPGRRPRLVRGPPGASNFARWSLLHGPPPSQPSGPAGWSRHSREPRRRALGRLPLGPPSFGPCFGRHDLASSSQ